MVNKNILFIMFLLFLMVNYLFAESLLMTITTIRGSSLVANKGISNGVKVGDIFDVVPLSKPDKVIAQAKVIIVKETLSGLKLIKYQENQIQPGYLLIKTIDEAENLLNELENEQLNITPSFRNSFYQNYAINTGSTMISGIGSYSSQGGDLFKNSDDDNLNTITLMPIINHFIAPNIFLGGSVSYTKQSQGDYNYHTIGVGPNIGFCIGNSNSKSFPFIASGIRYYNTGDEDNSIAGTDILISAGIINKVKDHIGIIIEFDYHILNLKHKDWEKSQSGNIIMIGLGIAGLIY